MAAFAPDRAASRAAKSEAAPRRRRVLHLAVDYPDAFDRSKTVAVRNFVKANEAVDHVVVALTRTPDPRRCDLVRGDGAGDSAVHSMRYWGLPFGMLHFLSLGILAVRIARLLARERIAVDLIHAHKLTFEGISGYLLSLWLKVPLACSVRAEVESKVLRYLPHYRPLFRRVIARSRRLYYVSLWFRPRIEALFSEAAERGRPLPNFCPGTRDPDGRQPDPDRFVTILHLDIFAKKGLDRLLPAFARFAGDRPEVSLDIIGRGSPESLARVQALVDSLELTGRARLIGPLPRAQLMERLPDYGAMCLPSHNETFGMVYVEALLSGVPIMYSRQTGIDGFLEGVDAAVGVDPNSVVEIAAALAQLRRNHATMRAHLLKRRDAIAARFAEAPYIERYNRELELA